MPNILQKIIKIQEPSWELQYPKVGNFEWKGYNYSICFHGIVTKVLLIL